jgi:predicted DNA-binding transcriptional regulator YafY
MVKKKGATAPTRNITPERAARLFRLVAFLGRGPQTRANLTRKLHLNVRGFYRDLEMLRAAGIEVGLAAGEYRLSGDATRAVESLPFPDPGLTLGEARQLSRGRSRAHLKLRDQIAHIER